MAGTNGKPRAMVKYLENIYLTKTTGVAQSYGLKQTDALRQALKMKARGSATSPSAPTQPSGGGGGITVPTEPLGGNGIDDSYKLRRKKKTTLSSASSLLGD